MIQARDIATLGGKAPQVVPIVGAEADTLAWMALNIFDKDAAHYHADGCVTVTDDATFSASGSCTAHIEPVGVTIEADWYADKQYTGDGYDTPRECWTEVRTVIAFMTKDGRRLALDEARDAELTDAVLGFVAAEVDGVKSA